MSESTKQKILNASIKLFNEYGIANVRLQQIAQEVGISPGNLAYHFKNKQTIIYSISDSLYMEADDILSSYRVYPNLIDLDQQLVKYFAFVLKYPFYFIDVIEIERNYPNIKERRAAHLTEMIDQIKKRFDFNVDRGVITPEPHPRLYSSLSETICVIITFWFPQNLVRGSIDATNISNFKDMIWNQFLPYFTEKGLREYKELILPILNQKPHLKS